MAASHSTSLLPSLVINLILEEYVYQWHWESNHHVKRYDLFIPFHSTFQSVLTLTLHDMFISNDFEVLPLLLTNRSISAMAIPKLYAAIHILDPERYLAFLEQPAISSYRHIRKISLSGLDEYFGDEGPDWSAVDLKLVEFEARMTRIQKEKK